jgi:hypothetical protein
MGAIEKAFKKSTEIIAGLLAISAVIYFIWQKTEIGYRIFGVAFLFIIIATILVYALLKKNADTIAKNSVSVIKYLMISVDIIAGISIILLLSIRLLFNGIPSWTNKATTATIYTLSKENSIYNLDINYLKKLPNKTKNELIVFISDSSKTVSNTIKDTMGAEVNSVVLTILKKTNNWVTPLIIIFLGICIFILFLSYAFKLLGNKAPSAVVIDPKSMR